MSRYDLRLSKLEAARPQKQVPILRLILRDGEDLGEALQREHGCSLADLEGPRVRLIVRRIVEPATPPATAIQ